MSEWWHTTVIEAFEGILLIGALMTAIGIGLKRVYTMARSVEKILEFNKTEKEARESVATDLLAHIRAEDARDLVRDRQIQELVDTVREISRETRPNGGSSMKDVLNHTAECVADINTRTSVLEEWKRMHDREYAELRVKSEFQK